MAIVANRLCFWVFIDLFLTCYDAAKDEHRYVIYVNNKQSGFEFAKEGLLPAGAGPVTFADMDGDGAVDMIVPACDRGSCSIYIYYNQQIPLCTSKDQKDCRQVANLCVADPNFTFNIDPDHNTNAGVRQSARCELFFFDSGSQCSMI